MSREDTNLESRGSNCLRHSQNMSIRTEIFVPRIVASSNWKNEPVAQLVDFISKGYFKSE